MLSTELKDQTRRSHQSLEAVVVRRIKSIRGREDYIRLLHKFYGFHFPLEQMQDQFLNDEVVPEYSGRRKASLILEDLEALGAEPPSVFAMELPVVDSLPAALGSFYVLEGSTQGGSIVADMLIRHAGMSEANTRFFNAYGPGSGGLWQLFRDKLDSYPSGNGFGTTVIKAADDCFRLFEEWMLAGKVW